MQIDLHFLDQRSRLAAVNQSQRVDTTLVTSSSEGSLYSASSDGDDADLPAAPSCARRKLNASGGGCDSGDGSVYSTLQAAVCRMSTSGQDPQSRSKAEEAEVAAEEAAGSSSSGRNSRKRSVRMELRARLQSVKLTSESGNASVIEVIEPSSSDDGDGHDVSCDASGGIHPLDQSTPVRNLPKARSFNASFSDELEKARQKKILLHPPPPPLASLASLAPLSLLPAATDAPSLDVNFS